MRTMFKAVDGDAPEITPDKIVSGVDSDADIYSLADRERLASAGIFRDLDTY